MNAPFNPVQSWMQAGQQWACTQQLPRMSAQVFKTNGIYMPPPGLTYCIVECLAAGGAGGRVSMNSGVTQGIGGGGGGSGGYSRAIVPAALVVGGVAVTVGAGGVGQTAANGSFTDGGDTSFGPLVLAKGGKSSDGQAPTNGSGSWFPGAGGAPGVGDVTTRGNDGGWGLVEEAGYTIVLGGAGGIPPGGLGGGINATTAAYNGQYDSHTYKPGNGCGGTGGVVNSPTSNVTLQGQPGGDGLVAVTEFCFQPLSVDGKGAPTLNIRLITGHHHDCGCNQCQQAQQSAYAGVQRLLEPSY